MNIHRQRTCNTDLHQTQENNIAPQKPTRKEASMSVSKHNKMASHPIQVQAAISCRSLSPRCASLSMDTDLSQTPLNELLLDIEDFSYQTMLPKMKQIQSSHTDKM